MTMATEWRMFDEQRGLEMRVLDDGTICIRLASAHDAVQRMTADEFAQLREEQQGATPQGQA